MKNSIEWTAIMYNVLAAATLKQHDELKGTSFYAQKVKHKGNEFLKEIEKILGKVNSRQILAGESNIDYESAMSEYAQLFDSFDMWFEAWQKFIQLKTDEQISRSKEIEKILNKK